ncbi:MAG: YbaB/EbfC family nucleoid-associated protein [Phycisphaeraceae bacterium]
MFDQFKNFGNLMKNAGAIREKAEQLKEELANRTVEGEAGGGAVRVTLNGKGQAMKVELDQNLLMGIAGDDKVIVEELIAAAINDGMEKVQRLLQEEMQKAAGGFDIPGLSGLFGGPNDPTPPTCSPSDESAGTIDQSDDDDEPRGPFKI